MTAMTSPIYFVLFCFIIGLVSIFVVMRNIFSVNSFGLLTELSHVPYLSHSHLVKTNSLEKMDNILYKIR